LAWNLKQLDDLVARNCINTIILKMISIQPKPNDEMISQAVAVYPSECAGFFYGVGNRDHKYVVTHVFHLSNDQNSAQKRISSISDNDMQAAKNFAADNKLELLGVYYSHADRPAVPSLSESGSLPENFYHIIVGTNAENFIATTCWKLNAAKEFEKVEIRNFP
jgi:proteasome lid subunit RPN8/RPN11